VLAAQGIAAEYSKLFFADAMASCVTTMNSATCEHETSPDNFINTACREKIKSQLELVVVAIKKASFPQSGDRTDVNPESPIISEGAFTLEKPDTIKDSFDSIIGLDPAKKELVFQINYLKKPASAIKFGVEESRGILFHGPPGTGKTSLARAFVGELGKAGIPANFIATSGSEFDNKYVGVGAAAVRSLFKLARQNKPTIIFIDEIDTLAKKRGGDKNESTQTLTQFLKEMEGFDSKANEGVFVIGATNRIEDIDPAAKRRFSTNIKIPLPTDKDRKAILEFLLKTKKKVDPNLDYNKLVKESKDWSPADLRRWVNAATREAFTDKKRAISIKDFDNTKDIIKK